MANTNQQMSLPEQNAVARNIILNGMNMDGFGSAIDRTTAIFTQAYSSAIAGRVINVPVRNVGLIKRFLVKLTFTVARSAAETQTRTDFGPANCLSSVVFTDLSNQNRVQTAGWHLHFLATARRQMAYGAAFTNDSPVDIGSNFTVISAPSSFTTGSQTVQMYYEIPVAYSDRDLRGGIYASVVNATMNLQLTVNQNFFVASGTDNTLAVYQSSSSDLGAISALTVTVYQQYLDQIPMGKNGPILPGMDLATAYLINNTVGTGMTANQDFAIPFANFRNFMSQFVVYNQNGTRNLGTDINSWALRAANYTEIWQYDAITSALMSRNIIGDDWPAGTYYFDFRNKPVNTVQYGNMELVMNPSSAAASSSALIGYEALTLINQVTQAGSLYNT